MVAFARDPREVLRSAVESVGGLFGPSGVDGAGDPRAGMGGTAAGGLDLALSQSHKWPPESPPLGSFILSWAEGGNFAEIRQVGRPHPTPSGERGGRGEVKGFSRASRLNCLVAINSINREQVQGVFFVTLTIRAGSVDWKEIERLRRAYFKRLRRRWSDRRFFAVWKKEAHKSGTPHLHCLIFWVGTMPHLVDEFRPWNDAAWLEVTGADKAWCRSEFMRTWSGVACYTAKYLGKDQEGLLGETGRIWGVENRGVYQDCRQITEVELSKEVGTKVRRCLRKFQQRKRESWLVFFEGRWHKIRTGRGLASIEEQVAIAKRAGLRVKRVRPRLLYRVEEVIWGTDSETGQFLPPLGTEFHSYSPAVHFIGAVDVARLTACFAQGLHSLVDAPYTEFHPAGSPEHSGRLNGDLAGIEGA